MHLKNELVFGVHVIQLTVNKTALCWYSCLLLQQQLNSINYLLNKSLDSFNEGKKIKSHQINNYINLTGQYFEFCEFGNTVILNFHLKLKCSHLTDVEVHEEADCAFKVPLFPFFDDNYFSAACLSLIEAYTQLHTGTM